MGNTATLRRERRRFPRQEIMIEAAYTHLRDQVRHDVALVDISRGGVGFIATDQLQENVVVRFFAHQENGKAHGHLVRIRRVAAMDDGLIRYGAEFIPEGAIDEKNRRRNPRLALDTLIEYHVFGGKEQWIAAHGLNLCRMGLAFVSKEPLRVGELLRVQFRGKDIFENKHICATARVIHSTPKVDGLYHIGVALIKTEAIDLGLK